MSFDDLNNDLGRTDYSGEEDSFSNKFLSKPIQRQYQPFGGPRPQPQPQPVQEEPLPEYGYDVQPGQYEPAFSHEADIYDQTKKEYAYIKSDATALNSSASFSERRYKDFFDNKFMPYYQEIDSYGDFDNDDDYISSLDAFYEADLKASKSDDSDSSAIGREGLKRFFKWNQPNGLRDQFLRFKQEKDERRLAADQYRAQEIYLRDQLTNIPPHARVALDEAQKKKNLKPRSKKQTDEMLDQMLFDAPIVDTRTGEIANLERTDPRKSVPTAADLATGKKTGSHYKQQDRLAAAIRGDTAGFMAQRESVAKDRQLRDRGFMFSSNGMTDGRPTGLSRQDVDLLDIDEMRGMKIKEYKGVPIEEAFQKLGGEERLNVAKILQAVRQAYNNSEDSQVAWLAAGRDPKLKGQMEADKQALDKTMQLAGEFGLTDELIEHNESKNFFVRMYENTKNAIDRGWNMYEQSKYADDFLMNSLSQSEIEDFIDLAEQQEKIPVGSAAKKFHSYKSKGFWDSAGNLFFENPEAIPELFFESMSAFLPAYVNTGKYTIPAGAGAGALKGAIGGPKGVGGGALVGAGIAARLNWGVASLTLEYSGMVLQGMQELNIDYKNPKIFAAAWNNETVRDKIKTKALKKGVPIAVFDSMAGMLGGRIATGLHHAGNSLKGGKLLNKTAWETSQKTAPRFTRFQRARNVGTELVAGDMILGAAGETLGQAWARDPGEGFDYNAIAAEAFVGVGPGAVGAGMELMRGKPDVTNVPTIISGLSNTPYGQSGRIDLAGFRNEFNMFKNNPQAMAEHIIAQGVYESDQQKQEATNIIHDVVARMYAANPDRMSNLKIVIADRTPYQDAKQEGSFHVFNNALEPGKTETAIYINRKAIGQKPVGVFLHEGGHLAREMMGIEVADLVSLYSGIGETNQKDTIAQYVTKNHGETYASIKDPAVKAQVDNVMKNMTLEAQAEEWFSHQFVRVLTGNTADKSVKSALQQHLLKFLHPLVEQYSGTREQAGSSAAAKAKLNSDILGFMGYDPRGFKDDLTFGQYQHERPGLFQRFMSGKTTLAQMSDDEALNHLMRGVTTFYTGRNKKETKELIEGINALLGEKVLPTDLSLYTQSEYDQQVESLAEEAGYIEDTGKTAEVYETLEGEDAKAAQDQLTEESTELSEQVIADELINLEGVLTELKKQEKELESDIAAYERNEKPLDKPERFDKVKDKPAKSEISGPGKSKFKDVDKLESARKKLAGTKRKISQTEKSVEAKKKSTESKTKQDKPKTVPKGTAEQAQRIKDLQLTLRKLQEVTKGTNKESLKAIRDAVENSRKIIQSPGGFKEAYKATLKKLTDLDNGGVKPEEVSVAQILAELLQIDELQANALLTQSKVADDLVDVVSGKEPDSQRVQDAFETYLDEVIGTIDTLRFRQAELRARQEEIQNPPKPKETWTAADGTQLVNRVAEGEYAEEYKLPKGYTYAKLFREAHRRVVKGESLDDLYNETVELNPKLKGISTEEGGYTPGMGGPKADILLGVGSKFKYENIKFFVEKARGSAANLSESEFSRITGPGVAHVGPPETETKSLGASWKIVRRLPDGKYLLWDGKKWSPTTKVSDKTPKDYLKKKLPKKAKGRPLFGPVAKNEKYKEALKALKEKDRKFVKFWRDASAKPTKSKKKPAAKKKTETKPKETKKKLPKAQKQELKEIKQKLKLIDDLLEAIDPETAKVSIDWRDVPHFNYHFRVDDGKDAKGKTKYKYIPVTLGQLADMSKLPEDDTRSSAIYEYSKKQKKYTFYKLTNRTDYLWQYTNWRRAEEKGQKPKAKGQESKTEGRKNTSGVTKIISGGQNGADQAGLWIGKNLGIETGGTAPKGFETYGDKDESEKLKGFGLEEVTDEQTNAYKKRNKQWGPRTEQNVINSDGTVIFGNEESGGSKLTIDHAEEHNKPYLVNPTAEELRTWLAENDIKTLNVAGNREATNKGIFKKTKDVLTEALSGEPVGQQSEAQPTKTIFDPNFRGDSPKTKKKDQTEDEEIADPVDPQIGQAFDPSQKPNGVHGISLEDYKLALDSARASAAYGQQIGNKVYPTIRKAKGKDEVTQVREQAMYFQTEENTSLAQLALWRLRREDGNSNRPLTTGSIDRLRLSEIAIHQNALGRDYEILNSADFNGVNLQRMMNLIERRRVLLEQDIARLEKLNEEEAKAASEAGLFGPFKGSRQDNIDRMKRALLMLTFDPYALGDMQEESGGLFPKVVADSSGSPSLNWDVHLSEYLFFTERAKVLDKILDSWKSQIEMDQGTTTKTPRKGSSQALNVEDLEEHFGVEGGEQVIDALQDQVDEANSRAEESRAQFEEELSKEGNKKSAKIIEKLDLKSKTNGKFDPSKYHYHEQHKPGEDGNKEVRTATRKGQKPFPRKNVDQGIPVFQMFAEGRRRDGEEDAEFLPVNLGTELYSEDIAGAYDKLLREELYKKPPDGLVISMPGSKKGSTVAIKREGGVWKYKEANRKIPKNKQKAADLAYASYILDQQPDLDRQMREGLTSDNSVSPQQLAQWVFEKVAQKGMTLEKAMEALAWTPSSFVNKNKIVSGTEKAVPKLETLPGGPAGGLLPYVWVRFIKQAYELLGVDPDSVQESSGGKWRWDANSVLIDGKRVKNPMNIEGLPDPKIMGQQVLPILQRVIDAGRLEIERSTEDNLLQRNPIEASNDAAPEGAPEGSMDNLETDPKLGSGKVTSDTIEQEEGSIDEQDETFKYRDSNKKLETDEIAFNRGKPRRTGAADKLLKEKARKETETVEDSAPVEDPALAARGPLTYDGKPAPKKQKPVKLSPYAERLVGQKREREKVLEPLTEDSAEWDKYVKTGEVTEERMRDIVRKSITARDNVSDLEMQMFNDKAELRDKILEEFQKDPRGLGSSYDPALQLGMSEIFRDYFLPMMRLSADEKMSPQQWAKKIKDVAGLKEFAEDTTLLPYLRRAHKAKVKSLSNQDLQEYLDLFAPKLEIYTRWPPKSNLRAGSGAHFEDVRDRGKTHGFEGRFGILAAYRPGMNMREFDALPKDAQLKAGRFRGHRDWAKTRDTIFFATFQTSRNALRVEELQSDWLQHLKSDIDRWVMKTQHPSTLAFLATKEIKKMYELAETDQPAAEKGLKNLAGYPPLLHSWVGAAVRSIVKYAHSDKKSEVIFKTDVLEGEDFSELYNTLIPRELNKLAKSLGLPKPRTVKGRPAVIRKLGGVAVRVVRPGEFSAAEDSKLILDISKASPEQMERLSLYGIIPEKMYDQVNENRVQNQAERSAVGLGSSFEAKYLKGTTGKYESNKTQYLKDYDWSRFENVPGGYKPKVVRKIIEEEVANPRKDDTWRLRRKVTEVLKHIFGVHGLDFSSYSLPKGKAGYIAGMNNPDDYGPFSLNFDGDLNFVDVLNPKTKVQKNSGQIWDSRDQFLRAVLASDLIESAASKTTARQKIDNYNARKQIEKGQPENISLGSSIRSLSSHAPEIALNEHVSLISRLGSSDRVKGWKDAWEQLKHKLPNRDGFVATFVNLADPAARVTEQFLRDSGVKDQALLDKLNIRGLWHQYYGKTDEAVKQAQLKFFEPIEDALREHGISLETFGEYLLARAAPSRNIRLKKMYEGELAKATKESEKKMLTKLLEKHGDNLSGIHTDTAIALVKDYEKNPEFLAFIKDSSNPLQLFYDLNSEALKFKRESGLIRSKQDGKGDIDEYDAMIKAASHFDWQKEGSEFVYMHKGEKSNYSYAPMQGFEGETENLWDAESAFQVMGKSQAAAGKGWDQPKNKFLSKGAFGRYLSNSKTSIKNDKGEKDVVGPDPTIVFSTAQNQYFDSSIRSHKAEVSTAYGTAFEIMRAVAYPGEANPETAEGLPQFDLEKEAPEIFKRMKEDPTFTEKAREMFEGENAVFEKEFRPLKETKDYTIEENKIEVDGKQVDGLSMVRKEIDTTFQNNPHVFVYRKNGVAHMIKFKQNERGSRVARSLKNLRYEPLPAALQTPNKIVRFMASMFTSKNPLFWIPNMIRDLGTMAIHLTEDDKSNLVKDAFNIKTLGSFMKGVWKIERDMQKGIHTELQDTEINEAKAKEIMASGDSAMMYQFFKQAGAKVGYFRHKPLTELVENFTKSTEDFNKSKGEKALKKSWKSLLDYVDAGSSAFENTVRMAAFWSAIKNGRTVFEASNISRNISVDFNQKGELSQILGSQFVFFSASVNSADRMIKTFQRRGLKGSAKFVAKFAGAAFILATLNRLMDDDDEEKATSDFDTNSSYRRDSNAVVQLPDDKGSISIPMPLGYNAIWALGNTVADAFWDSVSDEDIITPAEFMTRNSMAVMNAFNPIGGANISTVLTPSWAKPFQEVMSNEDFLGREITKEDLPFEVSKPTHMRTNDRTEQHWKDLDRKMNEWMGGNDTVTGSLSGLFGGDAAKSRDGKKTVSGSDIEHIILGYTGGPGQIFNAMFGQGVWPAASEDYEEWDPNKTPFIKKFYRETTHASYAKQRYYHARIMVKTAEAEVKQAGNNKAFANQIRKDRADILKLSESIKYADGLRSKIRAQKRKIEGSKLSYDQKMQRIAKLDDKEHDALRTVVKKGQKLGLI